MRKEICVYSIINLTNKKRYVGRATYFYNRKKNHINALKKNCHFNLKLQRAWNKYGELNFNIEVTEALDSVEHLDEREIYWIKYFDSVNNGYNLDHGGNKSKVLSEETRKKMSKNNPKVWKGKKYGAHNVSKRTYQYDLSGNLLKEWGSVTEITDFLGLNKDYISMCCSGKIKKYKGYFWTHEYKGEKIDLPKFVHHSFKAVIMICPNTNKELKRFSSIKEAQQFLKRADNKISMVCKGQRNTWAGFKWEYV